MTDQLSQRLESVKARADPDVKVELEVVDGLLEDLQNENERLQDEKEALQTELEKTTRGTLELASELEQRFEQLFETAVEGIYRTTEALDEYVMANPAFAELLGYESGEALCAAVDSIEDDVFVDADEYAEYSETLQSAGNLDQYEYRIRTESGAIRWVSDSVTALTNDEGAIVGYRGGVIDITEQKKQERDLKRQTNLSIVLNRVLRHNLRNDVTVVRGHTQMMADKLDGDPSGQQALSTLDELIHLSEKARELDEIVASDAEPQSSDIPQIVEGVVTRVRRENPSASITIVAADDITATVLPSFERAIRELVENAVEHSGDDPVVDVTIDAVSDSVEIRIADNGPGIDEQEASVLRSGTETPLMHGSGLGLWLTYWIVSSNEGSIDLTVTDEGTTLTVSLPKSTASEDKQQLPEIKRARDQYQAAFDEAGDGMTIVDDNARILDLNDEAARIYGLDRRELLGRSLREFIPEDFDIEAEWGEFQAAQTIRDEMNVVSADGAVSPIAYTAKSHIVPGQHLIVSRDITETKERERELEAIAQRLQLALEGTNTGVWEWDFDTNEVFWTESMERLFGLEPHTFDGTFDGFIKRVHPDDRHSLEEVIEASVENDETFQTEYRILRDDGEQRWVESRGEISEDETGARQMVGVLTDITERRERDQELRDLNQQLEVILDTAAAAIFLKDTDGQYLQMNQHCRDMLGIEDDEDVIGFTDGDLFPEDVAAQYRADDARVFAEGETIETEEEVPTTNGTRTFLTRKTPIEDEDGKTYALCAIATDITDRKEYEEELELTETVFRNTQDALFLIDVSEDSEFRIQRVNEGYESHTGLAREEITGKTPRELLGDEIGGEIESRYSECVERRETIKYVEEIPVEGDPKFWETKLTPRIKDGSVTQLIGATRDITERRERERRYNAIFNQTYQFTGLLAPDGTLLEANETALEFGGFDREDVVGESLWESGWWQGEEAKQELQEAIDRAAGGEFVRYEVEVQGVEGPAIIDFSIRPITDEQGTVSMLIPEGRDITERKEHERKVAEKTRQLEAIVQNTSEAIYIKDAAGYYQFMNESGADLFDHSAEDIIGNHDEDLFDAESAAKIRAVDEQIMKSGEGTTEETERFIDGEKHVFLDVKYPYRDQEGDVIGIMGISPDITERKQHVRELERQNEQLESFASVVSHDLRNPLNIAQTRLELAREAHESEHLDAIQDAHERMQTLIDDVLALARAGQTIDSLEPVSLAYLSDDCWGNVETGDGMITVSIDREIHADRSRLKQLLENVFRNAVEHGGEGVTVTIGDFDSAHGFYVEDDGSGIPEGERDELFEPGYSTGGGTGLGLNIVKQIAGAHDWEVAVVDGREGGTRFEFTGVEYADGSQASSE